MNQNVKISKKLIEVALFIDTINAISGTQKFNETLKTTPGSKPWALLKN